VPKINPTQERGQQAEYRFVCVYWPDGFQQR
jgi:hypothetical protein